MIEISKGKKVTSTRPFFIGGPIRNASITYNVFHINKIIQRKRKYLDFITDTLTELKEKKQTQDIDVTSSAFALLGMINWFYQWYKADGRLSEEKLIDDMVNLFFNGFLEPSAAK